MRRLWLRRIPQRGEAVPLDKEHAAQGGGAATSTPSTALKATAAWRPRPPLACANKCVFCWRHHTNPGAGALLAMLITVCICSCTGSHHRAS